MDNSQDPNSSDDDDDINLPPIKLPPPDRFDTRNSKEGKNAFSRRSKKRKKKGRSHPTDVYKDVRRKGQGGCCSGLGCFASVCLVFLIVGIGLGAYWLLTPFRGGGYSFVRVQGPEVVIKESPAKPTVYVGFNTLVKYQAPATEVPIGVLSRRVEISGDFTDNVAVRGLEVTCKGQSRYAKNLDVFALKFVNEGVQVSGDMIGKTLQ